VSGLLVGRAYNPAGPHPTSREHGEFDGGQWLRPAYFDRLPVLQLTGYFRIEIEAGYRIDILVAECIIVENKSVQTMPPAYEPHLLIF
jgi:hypothetical protein